MMIWETQIPAKRLIILDLLRIHRFSTHQMVNQNRLVYSAKIRNYLKSDSHHNIEFKQINQVSPEPPKLVRLDMSKITKNEQTFWDPVPLVSQIAVSLTSI